MDGVWLLRGGVKGGRLLLLLLPPRPGCKCEECFNNSQAAPPTMRTAPKRGVTIKANRPKLRGLLVLLRMYLS